LGRGLLVGGVCLFWGTFGYLSARRTRPIAALLVLIPAIAIYIPVIAMSNRDYERLRIRYAYQLDTENSNPTGTLSDVDWQVYSFSLIRNTATAASCLGAGCCIYAVARLAVRRGD
jgi:hypothetical protein